MDPFTLIVVLITGAQVIVADDLSRDECIEHLNAITQTVLPESPWPEWRSPLVKDGGFVEASCRPKKEPAIG
jgi:hypothetical protein